MRPTTTNEATVKDLRDGISAIHTLQASTARIESERARLLERHGGELDEKFLVRFASIEAGAKAAKEIEPIMVGRLMQALQTGWPVENYGINDIRSLHLQIDDAIEAHVLAAAPEDIRDGLNVWQTKTAITERTARPNLTTSSTRIDGNERLDAIIGSASALAENLCQISAEQNRCATVAKRFGVTIAKAA